MLGPFCQPLGKGDLGHKQDLGHADQKKVTCSYSLESHHPDVWQIWTLRTLPSFRLFCVSVNILWVLGSGGWFAPRGCTCLWSR